MIPNAEIEAWIEDPLPECAWPRTNEIDEEGFGFFRGTWFVGRQRLEEARLVLETEHKLIEFLDRVAATPEEFEYLATALEEGSFQSAPEPLQRRARTAAAEEGFEETYEAPLDGLEIGVAGLSYALSASGCFTAASCRSHASPGSWSDCPVVFFAAPSWRIPVVADLARLEGCGMAADRDMLRIVAPSVREMHRLGDRLIMERKAFRGIRPKPDGLRRGRIKVDQLSLPFDRGLGDSPM